MPFVSSKQAAAHYKISPRRLRERAASGEIARKPGPPGKGYLYEIPAGPASPVEVETEDYYFDGERYLFSLKSRRGIFTVPKETIEEFVAGYSSGKTINELGRQLGWPRKTVIEIKTALGKTHDSAPFTDEQIASEDESELIADMIRTKENRIVTEAERHEWRRVKDLVKRYDRFDKFVMARLADFDWSPAKPLKASRVPTVPSDGPSVVLSPTDFHAHKSSWAFETGQDTNYEVMRDRLADVTQRALERILGRCAPSEFIVGVGSDFFHVDNPQKTTTRGTPQDVDGTWARVFYEGVSLYRDYVETLASVAPVTLVLQAGNHDEVSSIALWQVMRTLAEFDPRITVEGDLQPRQYLVRGDNLICLNHGDGMADAKLAQMPAVERAADYGRARQVYVFRGHHHTFGVQEHPTAWVVHMPSLAGTDRWHQRHGYTGNRKALAAYVLDPVEGLTDIIPVYA